MGYLACPVCERESLADVSDLQQRVAAALNRPLSCPICSASVSGIQAFHHHLAVHLPVHHQSSYPDASPSIPTTPSSLNVPSYPISSSPEGIPNLEHLEISDSTGSPQSPSVQLMMGKDGMAEQSEPHSPVTSVSNVSSHGKVTQPHHCDLCGLIFSSEHFLKFHKDIIHSKVDFFDVTCKLCKEKFKDFEAYRNHVKESHSDRRYICDKCPKTFKMKGSLLVHMRMFHDPSSPGTCQLCKKTFTTKARKELHEKRYHGVGLEHVPTGRISPSSPSQKQQKAKSSNLGDAKSWLETLMVETRPLGEDGNGYRELEDQQNPQSMTSLSQQPIISYSAQQIEHETGQINTPEEQMVSQYDNHTSHNEQTEQRKDKETRDSLPQIIYPLEHDSRHMQKWTPEFQPYANVSEKITLPKNSPEMFYQQQKAYINLPGQSSQQTHSQSRPNVDCSDSIKDKKCIIHSHGESSVSRPVGTSHTQHSPVAIVSPQPQKSETSPVENQSNSVGGNMPYHTEARRNSFPLMNINKLGLSQTDASRLHQSNYISELSLTASAAITIPSCHNVCMPNALTVSQNLGGQQNFISNLNSNMALLGSETKVGVKLSSLVIPSSQLTPKEKVKECPSSPIQLMQVQNESCQSDMIADSDMDTNSKLAQNTPQDSQTADTTNQIRRQGTSGNYTTAPSVTTTRKEGTGKTDSSKQWECDVCKKSFTTKYFLKKHKRLHTGETPYACAECGKTFTFQQSYHKHILYHSDDKPHQCSYCGRAFKEMSTLHNHVRIHTGEKPFVCENCGKAFRQRVSYLVHQRIHTGVMPYTCEACRRSFRYKVSLRSHKCEPSAVPQPISVIPMSRNTDRIGEIKGQSGTPASSISAANPITLRPEPGGTAASPALAGVLNNVGNSRKTDDEITQDLIACSPTRGNSGKDCEVSYLNSNGHHQHSHQQQKLQQQQQQQEQDITKRQQEFSSVNAGRLKGSLETIDLAAISYDGLPVSQEGKKFPNKANRGSTQCVSPRTAGYHDPLSVAFLHALVDPQQGRTSQEGLNFPSLSPGSVDVDLDHDNFLTTLLM